MTLLPIIIILAFVGGLLWIVNHYVPLSDKVIKVINIVVGVAVLAWLLKGIVS